jgi:pilus assembly protein Flp/PilA
MPRLKTLVCLLTDDAGQGLVEYALIIALVSIVAMAALRSLGNAANNSLTNASNQLS